MDQYYQFGDYGSENKNSDYNVDVIMCIDATGSMDPILDEVKSTALSFESLFREGMAATQKNVSKFRVKVIAFRDYIIDSVPMLQSEFFELPAQNHQFKAFLDNIEASGGGDEPENSLESLAYALMSDWTNSGMKRRHVILLFTDASAVPLGDRMGCRNYPSDLPKSLEELAEMWEGCSQYFASNYESKAGRFIGFVPKKYPWTDMERSWKRAWFHFTDSTGLKDINTSQIVDLLTRSVN